MRLREKERVREAAQRGLRPREACVSVDFDAFELRTWAQICFWLFGYSDLRDILNDPKRCPHIEMGVRLQQASGIDVTNELAYAWKRGTADERKLLKALRGLAKGPNFGLPGGMRAKALQAYCWANYGVDISLEQAESAIEVWLEMYSEAGPYLDHIKYDLLGGQFGARGTIEQFVSKRVRGDVGYTDAANGMFQGLAADIAKCAGWRLIEAAYERRGDALYGCRPLAFIHDEWIYAVPRERLHEAGFRMAEIMIATASEYCPDVLFSASPAAFYRWTKEAGDPMFDASGMLIPWEEA